MLRQLTEMQIVESANEALKRRVEAVLDMALTTVSSLAELYVSGEKSLSATKDADKGAVENPATSSTPKTDKEDNSDTVSFTPKCLCSDSDIAKQKTAGIDSRSNDTTIDSETNDGAAAGNRADIGGSRRIGAQTAGAIAA